MKNKKKISVTQVDINKGTRRISMLCPIALALKRGFKVGYASVGLNGATLIIRPDYTPRLKLSLRAQRFILRFDSGKKVKPFSFIVTYEN